MADIVNNLFGLPSNQVRLQEEQQRNLFGQQLASSYEDPTERGNAQRGAMLGNAIVNFGSRLFGLESPELKRASTLEAIMQQTQQEFGSDPVTLYPQLAKRLNAAGFSREAMQVDQVGQEFKRNMLKEQSDIDYKQSMADYTDVLRANQEAALESKRLEQQGQVAYGALQAYKSITDPTGKERVWNTALDALAKKGLDVESLRELPFEQRESTLNSIVEGSDSSATRAKTEIAELTNAFKMQKLEQDTAMKQQANDLKAAIANLQAEVQKERIGSAREVALSKQIDTFGNQLKLLTIKEKNDTQAGYASLIGTKEFNKDIAAYLKNDVGLEDVNQIKTATNEFNTLYKNYLGQKDADGLPKYDNVTALNMAKKDIESKVETKKRKVLGVELPGSNVEYSGKANKPKVIKLD
jgi:acetolactate synthase small subunit